MAAGDAESVAKAFEGPQKETSVTLELERVIYASPRVLAAALSDPTDVMRYTRSRATGPKTPTPGAVFTWFGGSVQGQFLEGTTERVEDDKVAHLVSKWRFNTWADGDYALLRIVLTPQGYGKTKLDLRLSNIPEHDGHGFSVYETVKTGWEERILNAMGTILGLVTEKK